MTIDTIERAVSFASNYGNVGDAPGLLNNKPTESQLSDARDSCLRNVERAFALIRKHHGMDTDHHPAPPAEQPGFPRVFEWHAPLSENHGERLTFHSATETHPCKTGLFWALTDVLANGPTPGNECGWIELPPAVEVPPFTKGQRVADTTTGKESTVVKCDRYGERWRVWTSPDQWQFAETVAQLPNRPTEAEELAKQLEAALAERDALLNPQRGDIESQAAAWVAVWAALEKVGLLGFIGPTMRGGRVRAVEFIAHLAAELAAAKREGCDLKTALRCALGQDKARDGDIENALERTAYVQEMIAELATLREQNAALRAAALPLVKDPPGSGSIDWADIERLRAALATPAPAAPEVRG